jgi:hypothetical protein
MTDTSLGIDTVWGISGPIYEDTDGGGDEDPVDLIGNDVAVPQATFKVIGWFDDDGVGEHAVASGLPGSPEPELPLQLLGRNPLATGELLPRLGQAAVLVVRVGFVIGRREEQGTLYGVRGHTQAGE